MARSGARTVRKADATRVRIVDATIETLKREGFAGTSAREIARTGGFAQGVVFYHFGGMTDLLLAALEETSRVRLASYESAVAEVHTLPELVAVAGAIFREDLAAGHVKVLSELIAAAASTPGLGREIATRIRPWIDFVEAAIARVTHDSSIGQLVPTREAAFAIVALYLGLELLTELDGDRTPAEGLFASAMGLAQLLGPLLTPAPTEGQR
jgi:AcrR family transcriptional regulator